MTMLNLNFQAPITEGATVNGDFLINGIAINTTTTENNHRFLAEELRSSANTLNGVPLLIDHENTVESIKGRVIESGFDELDQNVKFKAKIMDEGIKAMIQDGRLNSVSIGASILDAEEADDGAIIARGITFKELSLVAVPADPGATFGIALTEAFNKSKEPLITMKGGKSIMTNKEETQTQDVESTEAEVEDNSAEENAKKLAVLEAKLAEYAKKERTALEESYTALCKSKGVEALDVSEMSSEMIETLMKQMKGIKEADEDEVPEVKAPEPKEEEAEAEEEEDTTESSGYNFIEGTSSLGGGLFTVSNVIGLSK